jgi:hypothetical protein
MRLRSSKDCYASRRRRRRRRNAGLFRPPYCILCCTSYLNKGHVTFKLLTSHKISEPHVYSFISGSLNNNGINLLHKRI